jgi:hypothetical protein
MLNLGHDADDETGFISEMAPFGEFLTQLFEEGKIVFRSPRAPHDRHEAHAVTILERAFQTHALSVCGPGIAFDPGVACAAAELVRQASWALVNHGDRVSELEKRIKMPGSPLTPSHHLSADLTLRYLPQVLRRARGLDPSDPLIAILARVLRAWPLSGALSDLDEGPLAPLDFDGHRGLLLLYAERLLGNDRPSWRPAPPGPAWEHVELVRQEHTRAVRTAPMIGAP